MNRFNGKLLKRNRKKTTFLWIGLVLAAIAAGAGYWIYRQLDTTAWHFRQLRTYWKDPEIHSDWALHAGEQCGEAPFIMPTSGFVAFFYGDHYRNGKRHQGVDIFGASGPENLGETPVVAAYDGYLTRLPDWKSSVIIRIPSDPLQPDRQIWTYYTHMADPDGNSFIDPAFPPGTYEVFVPAGTLLGYQGNYSADPQNPTGMHLHFSIVLDDNGSFRNELAYQNTLDPSEYLGVEMNGTRIGKKIAVCPTDS
jgi:peptidoglycan LD-endopeptidase LytH